ncbi:MAG: glycosyltransferase family 4 protein [Fulvivirga sp.]|uniref:glycosyltransferase family 4 protein n=1 Tax=Fulvivirga sp. TaxID=1931237 RepID=UPI0032EB3FF7
MNAHKVLFLADPHSIHDVKWIKGVMEHHVAAFIVRRSIHITNGDLVNVTDCGNISDFSIFRPLHTLYSMLKLKNIIKKNNIDILHIMYAEPNALWSLVAYFTQIKIVISCRGTDILKAIPEFFNNRKIHRAYISFLYKKAFAKAQAITGTSISQLQSIERLFGKVNSYLIRTGIDIKSVDCTNNDNLPTKLKNKQYVFFPRNMKPLYNHEFAIEAINLLNQNVLNEYSFVFIDSNSNDQAYVQLIEKKMQCSKASYTFLPRLNARQLYAVYKKSSLVVMTPISDGSPVSAMEAMAFEKPLILGPLEYDEDIFSKIEKLQSWDANQLAEAMTRCLNNDYTLKLENRRIIEKKANRKREMSRVMEVYNALSNDGIL